ncbi:MAG: cell division protein FtsQ/DivIB [Flavobacteriales bacterium]
MKKIWKNIGIGLAIVGVITLTAFAVNKQKDIKCWTIDLQLKVGTEDALTSEKQLKRDLLEAGIPMIGAAMDDIDLKRIHTALSANPLIKDVTVHKTVDGKLKINAEQRVPFIRIINTNGESFLVDKEGVKMPVLSKGNPRLVLFTGRINEALDGTTLDLLNVNDQLRKASVLDEIFSVASFIESSDFWSSQVEHVYVNAQNEFELVPRVGSHKILLGTATEIEHKFNRLEVFYKETIGKKDWNKYATIDLRFKDQVVCQENNF